MSTHKSAVFNSRVHEHCALGHEELQLTHLEQQHLDFKGRKGSGLNGQLAFSLVNQTQGVHPREHLWLIATALFGSRTCLQPFTAANGPNSNFTNGIC